MASKKPARSNAGQLSFDFDFNETLDAIGRLDVALEQDTDEQPSNGQLNTNLTQGTQNDRRTNTATSPSEASASSADPTSGSAGTVHTTRLEDSRPLGAEFAGPVESVGTARRSDFVGPSVGATESGNTSATRALDRNSDESNGGARDSRTAPDQHRTELAPSNYRISAADKLGQGGAKAKFRDNLAALQLMVQLASEGRAATEREQGVLVKYVGWGGLPQAFDHRNSEWRSEFQQLAALLPQEQYEAARRSTQDAHYTAQVVVEAMYSAVQRLGFSGGRVLESALGTGHFIGLMPPNMAAASKITGIELDTSTAAIAHQLYPHITVINKGFQEVTIPSGYFDLAIGNPPFGNQTLFDAQHRDLSSFSIHNYFLAKSLDKVRDGGLLAVVVSSYFLDAVDSSAREWISERAHLVGAMRLPNSAFKENALTEVTTDIVLLQKARLGETPAKDWLELGAVLDDATGQEIPLNRYFVAHPEMVLGRMALASKMYRDGAPTCIADEGIDLAAALANAIARLPAGLYQAIEHESEVAQAKLDIPANVKVGAYFTANGTLARRLPDILDHSNYELVALKNEKQGERIRGMIDVRGALRELMAAEKSASAPAAEVDALRAQLNRVYDGFVQKHGYISALPNRQAMADDPDYPLLHSLERNYDRGISKEIAKRDGVAPREASAQKAAIFSNRVIEPNRAITSVANAKDGLLVCLNEIGRVDLGYIVRLCGKTEDEVLSDLKGLIYRNPAVTDSALWESADAYLTGNVKRKLAIAEAAAKDNPAFLANVEALRLVQPKDIEPVDIGIQLGASWVPADTVDDFVTHLLGGVHRSISYQPSLGKWMVKIGRGDSTSTTVTWGTARYPANDLIEAILTNRTVQVKDVVGYDERRNPIYQINEEATAVANQKADEIRQAFLDWVWEDKQRRERLARIYNDTFNTNIAPIYDGSHLSLPGASMAIELRPHQKNAIWRGIQDGTALFDHVVGAGKTFEFIGVAMESRRMGLAHKPMIAVPNHLLLQWKDSFYELYPDAKLLIAEKSDFTKDKRERLFARIATGDWDAVIVGHSSLKKIGMPPATLETILDEQVQDLTQALRRLKEERGDRVTIKNMEKAKERMEAKLKRQAEASPKDRAVTFDELGVDMLMVDELHEFKNLFINTTLDRVAGLGNLLGSDKAFDLFVKARYLQMQYGGRGLFGGTGTPISNTIAELYTMQRYMQYEPMKQRGIVHFDAWASTFGQVVSGWELDATGMNYKLNSRFAKFQNVPELIALYRSFADVVTLADLKQQAIEQGKRFPVPQIKGGKPKNIVVERSPMQARYIGEQETVFDDDGQPCMRADGSVMKRWPKGCIIERMEHPPKDPRIDNPLKITNDARKAGLDFRLIDPNAADFEGSKSNTMVAEVLRIYREWDQKKGTQLIFCDLSTPKAKRSAAPQPSNIAEQDGDELSEEEDELAISMDELLAANNKFSVYDDIRDKLIAHGIPDNEIRFIHDANTDLQKAKLFEEMNSGHVRILMGSTAKMGAGTNVQRKLVAEHHLDAPWRPSDLEQREGRIIRQGNEFYQADPSGFEVEIIRYATEKTYDSRMWQTIEYKAAGIEQFRKGDSLQRTIEDIAGEAANAAEMKAAASGNPLIFMQVQIAAELKKAEAIFANFKRNQHTLQKNVEWLSGADERAEATIAALAKEIKRRDSATTEAWAFKSGKVVYTLENKEQLLHLLLSHMQTAVETQTKMVGEPIRKFDVGEYRGFQIKVHCVRNEIMFSLKGEREYQPNNLYYMKDDKFSLSGFLQRIDNYLESFEQDISTAQARLARDQVELLRAKEQLSKPFKEMTQLEQLRKDNSEVLIELKKMQKDESYVSSWRPASEKGHDNTTTSAAHEANITQPVQAILNDYLQAAAQPERAGEILSTAEHQAHWQQGDRNAVRQLVIENINTSPAIAQAVMSCSQHASSEMKQAASTTLERIKATEATLREAGWQPHQPNRTDGRYSGPIIAVDQHFVVQDLGMQKVALHVRSDFAAGSEPKVGEHVRFAYDKGTIVGRGRDGGGIQRGEVGRQ